MTHQYVSYDHEELNEGITKKDRLTIPQGPRTVRGILVVTNPSGGDTRSLYNEIWYGEFLFYHDFAFLGAQGFNSHPESYQAMQHALEKIAKDPLATKEVVELVETILADCLDILRQSQPLSDVLDMLDVFSEAGRPEAQKLVRRLDEVFR